VTLLQQQSDSEPSGSLTAIELELLTFSTAILLQDYLALIDIQLAG
jgi:hypothetical protein